MNRLQEDDFDSVPRKASIKHWKAQTKELQAGSDYKNMLAVCRRSEGFPKAEQTCDVAKGDKDLKWNPANPNHASKMRISYQKDERISSGDEEFDRKSFGKGVERVLKRPPGN